MAAKDESPAGLSPRSRYSSPAHARDSPLPQDASPSGLGKEPPYSPRLHRAEEERSRLDGIPVMPPPAVPSQTLSAQELRETAKQSIRIDKLEVVRTTGGSNAPSPRRRSPSPTSRPGTRNHSSESRASGGRSRSDRGTTDAERDERRMDRDRQESRDHAATLSRRDSITHTRGERSGRERMSARDGEKDGDRDKERDRGRDRHGDREKDRDRDHPDRVRDRDRDRERDRDRHRRDDKDRDRESRKERDLIRGQPSTPAPLPEDRALPTRPDPRYRPGQGEDGLGKRRRAMDDDPDRSSKRSSRKDGHRDDRGRRPLEKEGHDRNRESDRRRKERDGSGDNEPRLASISSDKVGDKRMPPEGPPPSSSSKVQPPIAPRAMSSGDMNRGGKGESLSAPGPSSTSQQYPDPTSQALGSLQSRIGAKEPPRPLPQPGNSYRPESQRKEDDRESRKRTVSDRDKDVAEPVPSPSSELNQVPKRPRINRTRYNNTAPNLAKKLGLPIDPSAGDRAQRRRD